MSADSWVSRACPSSVRLVREVQAILLAHERRAVALINERPANSFARQVGIEVLDVGGWIVLLADTTLREYLEKPHRSSRALTNAANKALGRTGARWR